MVSLFTFGRVGQVILRDFAVHRDDATLPLYFHAITHSLLQAVIPMGSVAALATQLRRRVVGPGRRIQAQEGGLDFSLDMCLLEKPGTTAVWRIRARHSHAQPGKDLISTFKVVSC